LTFKKVNHKRSESKVAGKRYQVRTCSKINKLARQSLRSKQTCAWRVFSPI